MRKLFAMFVFTLSVITVGCGQRDFRNGMPCQNGSDCLSGVCVSNKCVGRENGQACTDDSGTPIPGMCDSGQCEGTPPVCVSQTCSPVCNYGDVCLGSTTPNRCSPSTGAYNGEACYTGDRDCLSIKCNLATNTCEGRSDGSFCTQSTQCNAGSTCMSGVCQPNGSTCPPCQVGQRCVSGVCTNTLLAAKDSCTENADCASGFCDAGARNYWTCRAGSACTPVCPAANTVACGQPINPSNACGTCAGTGTYCASGTCNGVSCVVPTTDFSVSGPTSMTVMQGSSGSITITVSTGDNTSKAVALTVSNLPAGATASFNPSSVTVNNSSATSTLTVSVPGSLAAGTYSFNVNGTWNSNVRTHSVNLTVSTSGGSGLPNGSSCTQHSQCASLNCGPKFEANKTCNGTVDYNGTAAVATDCHSGRFITGTNRCGPDQFIGCAPSSAYTTFQFFSSSGALTRTQQVGGTGRCVISDPTRDETVATENGDIVCSQQTFWTDASVACIIKIGAFRSAIWNTGKPVN